MLFLPEMRMRSADAKLFTSKQNAISDFSVKSPIQEL